MKRVNIIGSGLSGLYLAINLARYNIESNLISQMPSERAQSILACGGINASLNTMGEDDNTENHFNDTLKGGDFLEPEDNIRQLINNSVNVLNDLDKLGVPFERKNNKIMLRNFGGQKKKRTAYAKSSTGKMIMTSLIDETRKYEVKGLIHRFNHHECIDVNIIKNEINYIIVKDLYNNKHYELKGSLVLACGGLNGLFDKLTTGTSLNNSNIQSLLFMEGLEFKNLEFIQFHPTTVDIKSKKLLISEAARGEGGRLFIFDKNNNKYYFMEDKYPELKNLMPRDVVSREEYLISIDNNYKHQIYLDLKDIKDEVWDNKLSDMREEVLEYLGIDPKYEYIPVEPGIHYFMGGINVDINHKTNINNIYSIGEAASIYHGANRLGGNSMLGALVGAKVLANYLSKNSLLDYEIKEIEYEDLLDDKLLNIEITNILKDSMSIVRDNKSLNDGLNKLDKLVFNQNNKLLIARINLAKAFILSALNRLESRGAHYRLDYNWKKEEYKKQTIAKYDKEITIKFM